MHDGQSDGRADGRADRRTDGATERQNGTERIEWKRNGTKQIRQDMSDLAWPGVCPGDVESEVEKGEAIIICILVSLPESVARCCSCIVSNRLVTMLVTDVTDVRYTFCVCNYYTSASIFLLCCSVVVRKRS